MEIVEALNSIAEKVNTQKSAITTEEATKNAFIMPFISLVLGYDVFNPSEVVPEFTADVGIKKGEKIDYAIVHDDEIQILIECKKICEPLDICHASQLFRYFATTNARIAILTNGEVYQFYSDLEKVNKMDEKPFLVLNLSDLDESVIPELSKLTKKDFDLDSILNAAEELKYIGELKRALAAQFKTPDDDWIKALACRVYGGMYTQKMREQFSVLVPKAMKQFLSDQVNDRLKAALGGQTFSGMTDNGDESTDIAAVSEGEVSGSSSKKGEVVTTLEETQGFQIVRAIVCKEVPIERIAARDTKSYFGVLLDDNNRKPIMRLHFNHATKYIGLINPDKTETRQQIDCLEDIYRFSDQICKAVHYYD